VEATLKIKAVIETAIYVDDLLAVEGGNEGVGSRIKGKPKGSRVE
jgi:hypothetical protein